MTQYSSGAHAKLTADPSPYVDQWGTYRNEDGDPAGYDFDARFHCDPRPEFDRPLTNPANPILADVRVYRSERLGMNNPKDWSHVLRVTERAMRNGAYTGDDATDSHADHARKVLQRLSAVFG